MSQLREIMQKLGRSRQLASSDEQTSDAGVPFPEQLKDYQSQLERCSTPMLRYEWTWLQQHLEDLELCGNNPEMLNVAGGEAHLSRLILQARRCLELLGQTFEQRGLAPIRETRSVVSGEHAWEVSNSTIRDQWGFDDLSR
jgi:hypothetical protein